MKSTSSTGVIKNGRAITWSFSEDRALIQFISLHPDLNPSEKTWPAMRIDNPYWTAASKYVKDACKTPHIRSCMYFLLSIFHKKKTSFITQLPQVCYAYLTYTTTNKTQSNAFYIFSGICKNKSC